METGQAAGALAALASLHNLPPREVPIQQVQRELLYAHAGLTLQNFADTPAGSDPWQAAEFAVV